MADLFNTIQSAAQGIYKDKGSAFISYIHALHEENDVKEILLHLKKEHPKARHICYAYRFGPNPEYSRIQDDGEPSGTAGKPILNQMKSHDLENVFIGVVRYFGGTLLGVTGLIHAYKSAAADAITQSKIISKRRNAYFKFHCTYPFEKQLAHFIQKHEGMIQKKTYQQAIEYEVAFPLSAFEEIIPAWNQAILEMQWKEKTESMLLSQDQY